ncbi:MAG: DUF748 domain-containing protein [Denitromonas halophila]|nr:MAG: DUF748 domain-containing protein [Denitromonas halophila]TVT70194.1 MAG: DUF748 domain-containing protein [Denitromonas halophila]
MSESETPTTKHKSRVRTWALRIAIALVVYALVGFFGLPALVKWQLPKLASEQLGRQVTLDDMRFNPFNLSLSLSGLAVAEADGTPDAARIGQIDTDLQWRSLAYWGLVFSRLNIDAPSLRLVRMDDTQHNWSDVVARFAQSDAPPDEPSGPARFSINNIQIARGSLDVDDRLAGAKHTLRELTVGVPFISGFPAEVERHVQPALSARVDGTAFRLDGRTRPFGEDLETVFDIELDALDITPYIAYLPFEPAFKLLSGALSTQLELAFSEPKGQGPRLTLAGTAMLAELEVQHRDDRPVVRLPKVDVAIGLLDVFGRSLKIDRIQVDQPVIHLRRLADGAIDVLQLMPPEPEAVPAEAVAQAPEAAFRVAVDQFEVAGGQLHFSDAAAPAGPFATTLSDITIGLSGFAIDGAQSAQLTVAARSEAGEQIAHEGQLAIAPVRASGTLTLSGLPLTHYAPYYANQLVGAKLTGGTVGVSLPYEFDAVGLRVAKGQLDLAKLALQLDAQKKPSVQVASLKVSGVALDTAARNVTVARIASTGGNVSLGRARDGSIDLARIVPSSAEPEATAPAEPAWKVRLAQTDLSAWALRFEDRAVRTPVVVDIERTELSVGALGTDLSEPVPLTLSAVVNTGGYVAAKGKVDLASLAVDMRLDVKHLPLRAFEAYATEGIEASLRSANLSLGGQLSVGAAAGQSAPPVRFRGDAAITDLIAVDTRANTDVLTWKRLAVDGLDVRTDPLSLSATEITLSDFFSRLVLSAEGRLNFREMTAAEKDSQQAAAAQAAAKAAASAAVTASSVMQGEFDGGASQAAVAEPAATATLAPPSPALPPIRIDRIVLEKGNVAFADRFVRPNYDANLTEVAGTLEGLSTAADSLATLSLTAAIDHAAPVTITGQLNPLREDRYLDIAASMRGFDLPTVSTYSGKYVGYGIAKGKLSADLSYKVTDRKLSAENKILLDQLTFGDAVDSPDAVNLPVQLAVALLKNGKGEIDLSVPVSGSLDDPQFSVAGLVWRAFFNLIGKAVTSPFALLGSVFGGGEELSYAEFAPGTHRLSVETVKKLETLAKALTDRPALKIDLSGHVDPARDEPGLREQWLLARMQERQREALLDAGKTPPALDDIEIPADQRDALLAEAYDEAEFEGKPRNFVGLTKSLPPDQTRALMLKNAPVTEADLAALGKARAQAVRDWLVGVGKISAERVFMVTPSAAGKPEAADSKDVAGSRVNFSLK